MFRKIQITEIEFKVKTVDGDWKPETVRFEDASDLEIYGYLIMIVGQYREYRVKAIKQVRKDFGLGLRESRFFCEWADSFCMGQHEDGYNPLTGDYDNVPTITERLDSHFKRNI